MHKKLLAVIAHPDDESFGFGGTLAKYAKENVEIHLLCATKGEAGKGSGKLSKIREQELLNASRVLGVTTVEFLNYKDGTLCNNQYHEVAAKIETKIKTFKPQVVLTFDRLGISGHLDHIFMSLVTTYVCKKYQKKLNLFYLGELKKATDVFDKSYFIFFPPGYTKEHIDVTIDISAVWKTKIAAMKEHQSQLHDVRRILQVKRSLPKREYFSRAFGSKGSFATDLFGA